MEKERKPDVKGSMYLRDVAMRLHARDNVAVARIDLQPGLVFAQASGTHLSLRQSIPAGHKLALEPIPAGGTIRRYGQVIGRATRAIRPGEHVHVHNVALHELERHDAFGVDAHPVEPLPESERRTFLGYRRPDGRVGTRNYVAVLSTVNCSAHVTRAIARAFPPQRLADFPHVDGVVPFTHHTGCGCSAGGRDYTLLQRVLAGIARHPNVGAVLLVGLGCETNQIVSLVENYDLGGGVPNLTIQERGGIRSTVEAGVAAVEDLLPRADAARRTPRPLSGLTLALQCGGSDSWSGVTANPLVGRVSDLVVRQGGTVVLAETPEICGAEHLLIRRAASPEVGRKLLGHVAWWERFTRERGIAVDDNRSAGNVAGGLTTIYEKSLGAIAKAGSTPLAAVYDYAEPVTARGFTFMDSPGYDPISVTGQVAGGCNLVLFTTGRGSVFGFKPAPCIKISTNSATYARMVDDMDVNAGSILEGRELDEVADELLELVLTVASGRPSKSEAQGVGEEGFVPWTLGSL
jgi:altronate dehydratase